MSTDFDKITSIIKIKFIKTCIILSYNGIICQFRLIYYRMAGHMPACFIGGRIML